MLDFSVTFVITIFNIAILFFILRALLFKPVTKFMADRAKRIQDSIEQSGKDREETKALLTQYRTKMETAEAEAENIINTAKEHAQAEAEKIIAQGHASAEAILENAHRQLEAEHKAALAVFKKEAASLVVAASTRLIGRNMESEDNRHYADMILEEISVHDQAGNN